MLLLWWLLLGVFLRETKATEAKTANSNTAYFSGNAFASYEPWNISGKMTFVFKTQNQSGLLFYQDDGNYANMNLQLKTEGLEMEITLGHGCRQRKFLVQGKFADSEWHRVLLEGSPEIFNLSVDGRFFKTIKCMQESPFNPVLMRRLYVRSFPRSQQLLSFLVSTNAFYSEYYRPERRFIGCLGRLQYGDTTGILHDVEMRESSGVTHVCSAECPTQNYCQETELQKISTFSTGAQLHTEAKPEMGKYQVSSSRLISSLSDLVTMFTSPRVATVTTKLPLTAVTMPTPNSPQFKSPPLKRASGIASSVNGIKSSNITPAKSTGIDTSPTRMEPTRGLTQVYDSINLSPVLRLYEVFQTASPAPYGLTFSKNGKPPLVSQSDWRSLTSQVGFWGGEHTEETTRFSRISSVSPYKVVRSLRSPTLSQVPGTSDDDKGVLAKRSRSSGRVVSDKAHSLIFYVALINVCVTF